MTNIDNLSYVPSGKRRSAQKKQKIPSGNGENVRYKECRKAGLLGEKM